MWNTIKQNPIFGIVGIVLIALGAVELWQDNIAPRFK